jgi:hypothetical protein
LQVAPTIEGPAFGKTPPFNVSLLADDPVQRPEAEWGDWRDTTYETVTRPAFTAGYIVVRLGRGMHAHDAQPTSMFPFVKTQQAFGLAAEQHMHTQVAGWIIVLHVLLCRTC